MQKIIASEWITLDGVFDAAIEYFSEWFLPYDSAARQECIRTEIESADTLLLGGATYRMFTHFWSSQTNDDMGPAAKLNSMPKVVVSTTLKESLWQNTEQVISENVVDEIKKLKDTAGGDILISGSVALVATLMKADLVDEFHFLVHPIIYGKGARFFKEGEMHAKLSLIETRTVDKGVVSLRYQTA